MILIKPGTFLWQRHPLPTLCRRSCTKAWGNFHREHTRKMRPYAHWQATGMQITTAIRRRTDNWVTDRLLPPTTWSLWDNYNECQTQTPSVPNRGEQIENIIVERRTILFQTSQPTPKQHAHAAQTPTQAQSSAHATAHRTKSHTHTDTHTDPHTHTKTRTHAHTQIHRHWCLQG